MHPQNETAHSTGDAPPAIEWCTIQKACETVGADKPIHRATYYRLAKRRLVPGPVEVLPGIKRVNLTALRAMIAAKFLEVA